MVIEQSGVQFGSEIIRVISKLNERAVRVQFEIQFEISEITSTVVSSNILLIQYWASLKLNSSIFWEEKIRVLETKVAKFATWYSMSFIFQQFIWNKPLSLIRCFVFCVAYSVAGKKMRFKAKSGAIRE